MNTSMVLILGANSDIATATARRFAKEGVNLQLASRDIEELEKTGADLSIRYNIDVATLQFDATDYASHKEFYERLDPKPDGVILAFGTMFDQEKTQSDFEFSKMMIETNYLGAVSILEVVAKDFEDRQRGFIAGISSVAGDRGRQSNYIYGSSKSGLSSYLQGLSHRLSPSNVSVLTVKPGYVDTKMTAHLDLPDLLTAKPGEVADALYKGILKQKETVYVKGIWRFIMLIIIHIPAFVFKKIKL
jgi:short-subunit dehydrogenase